MSAIVIDGRSVARKIREEERQRIEQLVARHGVRPGLSVILVGADPASQVYVRNKIAACREVGIRSDFIQLPADISQADLLKRIDELNADATVHGILVQLPLPHHIDIHSVLERISAEKDVDGFNLYNVGGLVTGNTIFPPCTPFGVQQDATVCICHKKTRDLAQFTILADILVVAAGVPGLITPQMVRTGAVVIDVGINRLPDGRITGDVDFEGVRQKASYISPVPGGVGPMTVAMLMHNTILSAERALGDRPKFKLTAL